MFLSGMVEISRLLGEEKFYIVPKSFFKDIPRLKTTGLS